MVKEVTLTIDNQIITVPQGTIVVDAAKAAGITIPVFCYHPELKPAGMCRICLVEIGRPEIDRATKQVVLDEEGKPRIRFGPKLETACTTPVSDGMVVVTDSPPVKDARRSVLEFLLTSHPLDCPVCDKGGECPLQNLTMSFGPGESRFVYEDKKHLAKHVPLGELIVLDRERCIQCGRCVRFQNEIAADPVIGFHNRGRSLEIISTSEPGFDSIFSGNTTDICPVGALTTTDFRFGARPWELKPAASICTHCPVGCNLTYSVRREARSGGRTVIKRTMPRQNMQVNDLWICDKGRMGYHFSTSPARLTKPLVRKEGELTPVTWDEALQVVAGGLRAADSELLTLVGGRLANEDLFNLRRLTQALDGDAVLYTHIGGGNWVSKFGLTPGTNLGNLPANTMILVVASDLHQEAPIWWLRVKQAAEQGARVIVINPRPTRLDAYAAHVVRYPYRQEVSTLRAFLPDHVAADTGEALQFAIQEFAAAENIVILFGSEGMGLSESSALAEVCAELLLKTGKANQPGCGLIGVWQNANLQGAWEMGFTPRQHLLEAMQEKSALYIVAADPVGDDPAMAQALQGDRFVVVQDIFLTETGRLADVVLPACPNTEREGSYTSGERRLQHFYPAVPGLPGARADFAIVAQLGDLLGMNLEARSAAGVFANIARRTPAYENLSYPDLLQTHPQTPLVGRQDLYYAGTAYQNDQGLGVHLPLINNSLVPESINTKNGAVPPVGKGSLMVFPITRLYDQGIMLVDSALLEGRMAQKAILIHPDTALKQGLFDGAQVEILWKGRVEQIGICLDENAPRDVALLPRSAGLPITAPDLLRIQSVLDAETVQDDQKSEVRL